MIYFFSMVLSFNPLYAGYSINYEDPNLEKIQQMRSFTDRLPTSRQNPAICVAHKKTELSLPGWPLDPTKNRDQPRKTKSDQ